MRLWNYLCLVFRDRRSGSREDCFLLFTIFQLFLGGIVGLGLLYTILADWLQLFVSFNGY